MTRLLMEEMGPFLGIAGNAFQGPMHRRIRGIGTRFIGAKTEGCPVCTCLVSRPWAGAQLRLAVGEAQPPGLQAALLPPSPEGGPGPGAARPLAWQGASSLAYLWSVWLLKRKSTWAFAKFWLYSLGFGKGIFPGLFWYLPLVSASPGSSGVLCLCPIWSFSQIFPG